MRTAYKVGTIESDMKFGAAILAGGHSRRMGEDKATLTYGGKTFLQRIASELEGYEELIVSVDVPERYGDLVGGRFADIYKDCAPKGGVHAALTACLSDALLVVPCDVPLFKKALGDYLCALAEGYDAVVPVTTDGRKNPLCAVYAKSCAEVFEEELTAGEYRMMESLRKLKVRYVSLSSEQSQMLRNINTPDDFRALGSKTKGGSVSDSRPRASRSLLIPNISLR